MILRFKTSAECAAYIEKHQLCAWVHQSGASFIAVFAVPHGVCAVCSPTEGQLLTDW